VVEDEHPVRELVAKVLRGAGYTVLAAPTPRKAMSISRSFEGEIHLVLSDVVMPEMNGVQLIDRLKQSKRTFKALLVSGYQDVIHSNEKRFPFMNKPFTGSALARKVRETLDGGPTVP